MLYAYELCAPPIFDAFLHLWSTIKICNYSKNYGQGTKLYPTACYGLTLHTLYFKLCTFSKFLSQIFLTIWIKLDWLTTASSPVLESEYFPAAFRSKIASSTFGRWHNFVRKPGKKIFGLVNRAGGCRSPNLHSGINVKYFSLYWVGLSRFSNYSRNTDQGWETNRILVQRVHCSHPSWSWPRETWTVHQTCSWRSRKI